MLAVFVIIFKKVVLLMNDNKWAWLQITNNDNIIDSVIKYNVKKNREEQKQGK